MRAKREWYQKLFRLLQKGTRAGILPPLKMLEFYPPLLFLGVRFEQVSKDFREVELSVPMRWYSANFHGTHFGGNLCAVADPLPALICARLFDDVDVWTRDNKVEFLKPARGRIHLRIHITDADMEDIRSQLDESGKASRTFEFDFTDRGGNVVAHVTNTAYLKLRTRAK